MVGAESCEREEWETAVGLLEGVRVIDLGDWHTGPATGCMLADLGADVVRIEGPGGDVYRHTGTARNGIGAQWIAANRNKRFVQLDIKQPADLDRLKRLIAKADVFVHNTRPGAMARAGLDAETLRAVHPGLIHASVSAYGQTGPYATDPGFDTLFQCLSGLCYMQGGDRPEMVRTLIVDKIVNPIMANTICAALVRKGRTGEGATIELSMLEAFIWWLWPDGMTNSTFIGSEGVRTAPNLSEVDMLAPTDDGYLMAAVQMQHHWERFCQIVDRPELLNKEGLRTPKERMQNLIELFQEIRASFKGKTTAQWCELLREAEIPNAPVLRPEQLEDHPQVQFSGCIEIVEDEVLGRYRSPKAPVRIDGVAPGTRRPPREAGADNAEVFEDWAIG